MQDRFSNSMEIVCIVVKVISLNQEQFCSKPNSCKRLQTFAFSNYTFKQQLYK